MQNFYRYIVVPTALVAVFVTPALAQAKTEPSIKILTPPPAKTIYGSTVPVLISVENLKLTDFQTNTRSQPGQGHIHLWLDDETLSPQSAVKITSEAYTFNNVSEGEHTLVAEIVNNNHSSLTPAQTTTVKFISAPVATPSTQTTSGFDKNTALVILVIVALVIIAAWWYTKEEDNEEETEESEAKKTTRPKRKTTKRSGRK